MNSKGNTRIISESISLVYGKAPNEPPREQRPARVLRAAGGSLARSATRPERPLRGVGPDEAQARFLDNFGPLTLQMARNRG